MQRVKVKMGSDNALVLIIGRILQRSEFIYFIFLGQHHDAAGVLARGPLNLYASLSQPVLLGFGKADIMLLAVFQDIAYGRFFCHAAYCSGAEYV